MIGLANENPWRFGGIGEQGRGLRLDLESILATELARECFTGCGGTFFVATTWGLALSDSNIVESPLLLECLDDKLFFVIKVPAAEAFVVVVVVIAGPVPE